MRKKEAANDQLELCRSLDTSWLIATFVTLVMLETRSRVVEGLSERGSTSLFVMEPGRIGFQGRADS